MNTMMKFILIMLYRLYIYVIVYIFIIMVSEGILSVAGKFYNDYLAKTSQKLKVCYS